MLHFLKPREIDHFAFWSLEKIIKANRMVAAGISLCINGKKKKKKVALRVGRLPAVIITVRL